MKTFLISDTHGHHRQVIIPEGTECIIHSGDSTNWHDWLRNQPEFEDFLDWFTNIDVKYKVLIPGNHDAWALKKYNVDKVKERGIIFNEHGYESVNDRLMFLSAYTPTFGNWHFMKDRQKLSRYWEELIEGIDVLVTHGPPKGILDIARKYYGKKEEGRYYGEVMEFCGDNALFKHVNRVNPKVHTFGHIHNNDDIINYGSRTISGLDTIFYNASMVYDGDMTAIKNKGHIINI